MPKLCGHQSQDVGVPRGEEHHPWYCLRKLWQCRTPNFWLQGRSKYDIYSSFLNVLFSTWSCRFGTIILPVKLLRRLQTPKQQWWTRSECFLFCCLVSFGFDANPKSAMMIFFNFNFDDFLPSCQICCISPWHEGWRESGENSFVRQPFHAFDHLQHWTQQQWQTYNQQTESSYGMMPSMAANATVNLLGVKKETAKVRQHLVMAKGGFLVTGNLSLFLVLL